MDTATIISGVSFARTPLSEISAKASQIQAIGWTQDDDCRGDPWVASFQKDVDVAERDPEAELRSVMGDYWVNAAGISVLLDK